MPFSQNAEDYVLWLAVAQPLSLTADNNLVGGSDIILYDVNPYASPGTNPYTMLGQADAASGSINPPSPPPPSSVPEPMSLALLCSGLIGLGVLRRRKRMAA